MCGSESDVTLRKFMLKNGPSDNLVDFLTHYFINKNTKISSQSVSFIKKNEIILIQKRLELYSYMIKDDVDFNDFAKLFRKGAVPYGNYWTILKSAWRRKDHPNLKILWFEEMKNDMMKVIRDVAYFIGHPISEYKVKVS